MLYIGSTKKSLNERLSGHKYDAKRKEKKPCLSHKILNNNDYIIYEIEKCEENMRKEREQYWMDNTNNINKQKVIGNRKVYNINYQKNLRVYHKSWGGDIRFNNNLLLIDTNLFI
jgi:hypothetical protein